MGYVVINIFLESTDKAEILAIPKDLSGVGLGYPIKMAKPLPEFRHYC